MPYRPTDHRELHKKRLDVLQKRAMKMVNETEIQLSKGRAILRASKSGRPLSRPEARPLRSLALKPKPYVATRGVAQAAKKVTAKIGAKRALGIGARVLGRAAIPVAVAMTVHDVGVAAREGMKAFSAHREAKQKAERSRVRYETQAVARVTRKGR